jgi:hypothetical protein
MYFDACVCVVAEPDWKFQCALLTAVTRWFLRRRAKNDFFTGVKNFVKTIFCSAGFVVQVL